MNLSAEIIIRPESPEDIPAIRRVNEQAFGRADEANIVDSLRKRGVVTLSLVAVQDDQIVGHILFSPVTIASETGSFEAVALGPMAVLPSHQRLGIGSQLVRAGLEKCKKMGQPIVIVLGHPEFYPRFGFKPSRPFGIRWEKDVPDEVFMVAELTEGALNGRGGVVIYQSEFRG
ncbi:MAG: N-acetyltransferase [Chloroflexi bacterium]|nr:N-acetyltransferase [Chloroflexota bacterium]